MDNKSDATFSVKYGPKDILDKSFKNKVRGYDPDEVDEFLDGSFVTMKALRRKSIA